MAQRLFLVEMVHKNFLYLTISLCCKQRLNTNVYFCVSEDVVLGLQLGDHYRTKPEVFKKEFRKIFLFPTTFG